MLRCAPPGDILRTLHQIHPHRRISIRTMATSGSYATTPLTRIVWGPGSLSQLPELLDSLPALAGAGAAKDGPRRALILTGNSLASKTDVIRRAEHALGPRHAATFTGIGEHAPVEGIQEAVRLMQQHGATALVAIGGGSPIDAAKAVSFYIHRESEHAADDDERTFVPIIAVPTTLSAAETTQNAGFTENKKKTGVSHRSLVPRVLLLDGETTRHTPERLWLSTGMRAVDHSIELLYRPEVSPLLRGTWLMAMRELFTLLPLSKAQPDNIDVRQRLQLAAIASLWPESRKGALGLSHGLGHALGATYKIGHGITSCLTLGPAIQLTAAAPSTGTEQLLALADARAFIPPPFASPVPLGASPSALLQGKPDLETARRQGKEVGEAVQKLVDELGLHSRLEPLGVPHEDLPKIAAHVAGDDKEKASAVTELLEKIFK